MSKEHIPMTAAERSLDRLRNDAYYIVSGALASIRTPKMSVDDIEHAIDSLNMARTKLEAYADGTDELNPSDAQTAG